ncbi:MAG: lysophospholipid acyltransferase family protein [Gammaproteobacteria bacterium]|nr:lysophospholipid acyltransferase family protein [Gammaproteobacteria bacterium]MDD9874307.1 lysophospholipid acyltransferase family protein [Gammaproteobacteria bacterium]
MSAFSGMPGAAAGAVVGVIRLLLILLAVAFGLAVCALAGVLGRAWLARMAVRWNRVIVKLLGVRSRYRGAALADGALLLSNHISWLDTLLFGARWPVVFLAKSEIAHWPVLGWLARCAGTLFIKRGQGAPKAARDIGRVLQQARSVVLFPEGRTTDGRGVIRFQPRLIQAAIDTGAPVQAAAVRYFDRAGQPVTRHSFAINTLLRGVWNTVSGPAIIAEITLFEPLAPVDDRQTLAHRAEQSVRARVECGGG